MVCRMKSHRGSFQKKSFSCVLWAFSHVFFLVLLGKNEFLDGFLVVFTVVRPLVWLLEPPFLQALQGTHHIYFYSLLYQMK